MSEWLISPLLAALGFFLGFFYTRTVKLSDALPDKYMRREDCVMIRRDCQHIRDMGREEVLARLDRLDTKMDRLSERVIELIPGE
jgi:hypothetical protein